MLTLLSTTWSTASSTSSMRMYHANAAIPPEQHARRVEVPSGFALFLGDLLHPPREWLDRVANTVRVTEPAHGGHFAPHECPEVSAAELRAFFRPYRTAGRLVPGSSDGPGPTVVPRSGQCTALLC